MKHDEAPPPTALFDELSSLSVLLPVTSSDEGGGFEGKASNLPFRKNKNASRTAAEALERSKKEEKTTKETK